MQSENEFLCLAPLVCEAIDYNICPQWPDGLDYSMFQDSQLRDVARTIQEGRNVKTSGVPMEMLLKMMEHSAASAGADYHAITIIREWKKREALDRRRVEIIALEHGGELADTIIDGQPGISRYESAPGIDVIDPLAEINMPDVLIDGIIHKGHVGVIAAPSKAGKTWAMIQLGLAVANGWKWLHKWQCSKGNVLFLNMELDKLSFAHRVKSVLNNDMRWVDGFYSCTLRGHKWDDERGLEDFRGFVLARAKQVNPVLIIIDPIYYVFAMAGLDENSNSDAARFFGCILSIAQATGAAVIFVHHYNKGGDQNHADKKVKVKPINRMSGAGVFARAPDFIMCLDPHEGDIFNVEMTARNFPPMKGDFQIMRKHPHWKEVEFDYGAT